jgi:inositol transporter-like SP family MFS transporter
MGDIRDVPLDRSVTGSSPTSTPEDWKNTVLAGLANYIDGGSIVAGAAGLSLWAGAFGLSSSLVGVIAAFSSNAISAGVGALVGGRLCDKFGRKRIYQWDMLLYAFGVAWIVFAAQPWMLILGYVLAGLAVGADVPASWTLIAESAPDKHRGRHSGMAQILWYLGPVVVLVMTLALSSLGLLGIRIVFAHLLVLALALWAMRRGMAESSTWQAAQEPVVAESSGAEARERTSSVLDAGHVRQLFSRQNLGAMLFLAGMYGIWNLFAGTNGFFLPYILRTVGSQSQAMSVALQCAIFVVSILAIALVFMPFVDRANQKWMFGVAAAVQVVGVALFAVFPLTLVVTLGYVLLVGIGQGLGQQSFFQLWSGELFPTLLRSTAQGLIFAVVRIALGIWSFFVPVLTANHGLHVVAWILTGFVLISGAIGWIWAPANGGKSLEEIERERQAPEPVASMS